MAEGKAIVDLVRREAVRLRERLKDALNAFTDEESQFKVNAAFDECLQTLAATGLWGEANRLPSSELWNVAGDILQLGWLQERARMKPRGYAGDYELLARIFTRQLCDHPLGRWMDRYFQAQAAPQAVRNRIEMGAGWIEEAVRGDGDICRVVVIGSGPAIEIALACQQMRPETGSRLRVILLDMDDQALESAATRLTHFLSNEQLTVIQVNLFRLAQRPALAAHLDGANLILCAGLFDYLDAPAATAMLGAFWRRLAPGGAAYVFNFASDNPTRSYMEWIGNWYLTYRNEGDLANLAAFAGISQEQWSLGSEPLGIDLFLRIAKT